MHEFTHREERRATSILTESELDKFDEGVELEDVTKNYKDMMSSINEFKENSKDMKNQSSSGHDEQESVNLKFIKMQVLDMAERFD